MPRISALRRLKENFKFKASQGCITRQCLKKRKKPKKQKAKDKRRNLLPVSFTTPVHVKISLGTGGIAQW
jgi:hypothetical protein